MRWLNRLLGRPTWPDNSKLEGIFAELAREDTPTARARLYQTLLKSRLMLATPGRILKGQAKSSEVGFIATTASNGMPAMVAFTSLEALLAWRSVGCDTVELAAKDAFKMAANQALCVVLNPKGPSGGYLTHGEVSALARGTVPTMSPGGSVAVPLRAGTRVLIGKPASDFPAAVKNRLREHLQANKAVVAAWVIALGTEDGPPRRVIAIQLEEEIRPDTVFPALVEALIPFLPPGEIMDLLPVAPGDVLLESIVKTGPPIYAKKSRL